MSCSYLLTHRLRSPWPQSTTFGLAAALGLVSFTATSGAAATPDGADPCLDASFDFSVERAPADQDGNGTVDFGDLVLVLSTFGAPAAPWSVTHREVWLTGGFGNCDCDCNETRTYTADALVGSYEVGDTCGISGGTINFDLGTTTMAADASCGSSIVCCLGGSSGASVTIEIEFEVLLPTTFAWSSDLDVCSASAEVRLEGPGTLLEGTVDADGILMPGTYELRSRATGKVDCGVGPCIGAFAWTLDLDAARTRADVDGDGSVGMADVLQVLAAWSVPEPIALPEEAPDDALTAPGGAPDDAFGHRIAVGASDIAIAAPGAASPVPGNGVVHVYDGTTAAPRFVLDAGRAGTDGARFGSDVHACGHRLAVGATGAGTVGRVDLFDLDDGALLVSLESPDGAADDAFGHAVRIAAGRVLVGAPGHDAGGDDVGAVYAFDVASGSLLWKTVPARPEGDERFGSALAVDDTTGTVLVGAPGRDGPDPLDDDTGAVSALDLVSGDVRWRTVPRDPQDGDHFGASVVFAANAAVVGMPGDDDLGQDSGSVAVLDPFTGVVTQEFSGIEGTWNPGDRFGTTLAEVGGRLMVGAPGRPITGGGTGSVIMYEDTVAGLIPTARFVAPAGADAFGEAIAGRNAARVLIGAPATDAGAGFVSLFEDVALCDLATFFDVSVQSVEGISGLRGILAGDFDADGDGDVVRFGLAGFRLHANDGTGTFSSGPMVEVSAEAGTSADFDGDGAPDLALVDGATLQIMLADGAGGFIAAPPITLSGAGSRPSAGDCDGDGSLDLVVAQAGAVTSVHLNDGRGTFGPGVDLTWETEYGFPLSPVGAELADFTGDGVPDIAVAFTDDDGTDEFRDVRFRPGLGGGAFGPDVLVSGGSFELRVTAVTSANVFGSTTGVPELLTGTGSFFFDSVGVRIDIGGFNFPNAAVSIPFAPVEDDIGVVRGLVAHDLRGMGQADVLVLGDTTQLWRGTPAGWISGSYPISTLDGAVLDVDGDGAPDVVANTTTGLAVFRSDCGLVAPPCTDG